MRIVYVMGGNYGPNGMSMVLSQKINWLVEHTDYELFMILTERPDLPFYYPVNPKVRFENFNIGFDELDTMPIHKKFFAFRRKQKRYRKAFSDYLMRIKPDIVVSTVRRELSFINDLTDGSRKVGEIHFPKSRYRDFSVRWLPTCVNSAITNYWRKGMINQIKRLAAFTVLSEVDRMAWTELEDVNVISNPLSRFPEDCKESVAKTVIAAGRYSWEKGYDMLLEAWAEVAKQHPDWHLNIYGGGDSAPFQQQVATLGLQDYVTCNQAVSDVYEKYMESAFLVLSSRYEGFGLVLAEAMSCGRPVVSFDCPCGPRSIVHDGKDGLLAAPENPSDLANKICWMIEHDAERHEMGRQARKSVKRFSMEVIMPQWVELFEGVVQNS